MFEKEMIRRLANWFRGKKEGPMKIDIEPIAGCNLKCRFCWTRNKEKVESCRYERTLTEERIMEIIKEAAELGVKEWQIAGGWEPMLNPQLAFKMMKLIKQLGMYGCITTNGTLFTKDMIRRLVEIGWDQILFSVEGPDAETHDYLTCVEGSFEKVKRNLMEFKKWKEYYRTSKPKYSIHAVLCNKNFTKLKEMIKFGFETGCSGVNFEPLIVWSEEGEKLKIREEDMGLLKKNIKEALKIARKLNVPTNLGDWLKEELVKKEDMKKLMEKFKKGEKSLVNAPCFNPWLGLEIRVSGRVTVCRLCDDETGCDNILDKSLKEIWFGEYFEKMREDFIHWNLPRYCSNCASGVFISNERLRRKLKEVIACK